MTTPEYPPPRSETSTTTTVIVRMDVASSQNTGFLELLAGRAVTPVSAWAEMADPQQPQRLGWRGQVRDWLKNVQNHQSAHFTDIRTAAVANQASFPKNLLMVFLTQFVRVLARVFVRDAIKSAATDLGLALTDSELNLLTEIALTALTS